MWVEGNSGATAKFRTLWDENHLYVYAIISDSLLSDASPNVWEQDSVEIFVDQNNGKTDVYQEDDGQYRMNFNNARSFGGHAGEDNFVSAAKVIEGGYVVEAAIRLDKIKPEKGTVIGFDLQVNNDEDGQGTRDSVVIWSDPTGQSYQNTSRFGVLNSRRAPLRAEETETAENITAAVTEEAVQTRAEAEAVQVQLQTRLHSKSGTTTGGSSLLSRAKSFSWHWISRLPGRRG